MPGNGRAPETVRVAVQCVSPDPRIMAELTAAFAPCLRGAAISRQVRYPAPGAALPSGLAVVDVSSDPVAAMEVLKAFAARPACATIAVLQDKDVSLMLTCLRSGALDLLVPPLAGEPIAAAVERVRERRPEAFIGAASARVLAFVAAPGGSGATTICQSVAFAWKRKFPTTRILLADLDPLTGIQGFLLKLKCPYSFLDVLRRSDTIDADLWKGTIVDRYWDRPAAGSRTRHTVRGQAAGHRPAFGVRADKLRCCHFQTREDLMERWGIPEHRGCRSRAAGHIAG